MIDLYAKFIERMRSLGLKAFRASTISSTGKCAQHEIRVYQELEDGCNRGYGFEQVDNPTSEYLTEHEQKALAFFELK
jgi:hypothetical protein